MGLLPAISSPTAVVRFVTCRKGRQVSHHRLRTESLPSSGTFCLEVHQSKQSLLTNKNQKLIAALATEPDKVEKSLRAGTG